MTIHFHDCRWIASLKVLSTERMFGNLLSEHDTFVLGQGTSDHAMAYARAFDATKHEDTSEEVRDFAQESVFMQCWPHISQNVSPHPKCACMPLIGSQCCSCHRSPKGPMPAVVMRRKPLTKQPSRNGSTSCTMLKGDSCYCGDSIR